MLSTHKAEVVPVKLEKHPNADSLSIVTVFGYDVVVRTEDFKDKKIAVYLPTDSIVPATPEYDFLHGHYRIKACKLRGVVSYGMLIQAPEGAKIGEDLAKQLKIEHYEPQANVGNPTNEKWPWWMKLWGKILRKLGIRWKPTRNVVNPPGIHPCYDVDALRRYKNSFHDGEPVWVTEKIDGTNARFTFVGRMFSGTHYNWVNPICNNVYVRVVKENPEIAAFCKDHPGLTLYAEIYGDVQKLKYGKTHRQIDYAVFDILDANGKWLDAEAAFTLAQAYELHAVPVLAKSMLYSFEEVCKLANGPSLIPGANHLREGVVVKPTTERTCTAVGRVNLKVVSPDYLAMD